MAQYRKKPVVVEANQWLGEPTLGVCYEFDSPEHIHPFPHVHTIHNNQAVRVVRGDWILSEPDGVHFYPCKPNIFEATYEPV